MGNLLFTQDNNYIPTGSCYKCNDTFKLTYGGRSIRTSCRIHTYNNNNNICITCNKSKSNSNGCYHLKYK